MRLVALPLFLFPVICSAQKPADTLEPLSFLVGEWKSQFTRKSPTGKVENVASTVRTRWRLEGQFLEMEESQSVDGKSPSTTMLLVTYDKEKKAYQGYIFTSSFPTFPMAVLGNFEGNKLTFTVDVETSPVKASFVYEKEPDGKYRGSSAVMVGEQEMRETAVYSKTSK